MSGENLENGSSETVSPTLPLAALATQTAQVVETVTTSTEAPTILPMVASVDEEEPLKKTKTRKTKTKKAKAKKREGFWTKKDIIISVLVDNGIEELVAKHKKNKIKPTVLRAAAMELEAKGKTKPASMVMALLAEWYPSAGQRGRTPPEKGEVRTYSAQQIEKNQIPFVRIPVAILGVSVRGKISAKFEQNRIVLTPAE